MKKLLFALALLLIPHGAFAASCDPNRDKWTSDAWCITSQDTLIPTTAAGQQVIYAVQTTSNTPHSFSANDSGVVYTDYSTRTANGSAACSKHTLPRASVGLTYTLSTGSICTATLDTVDANDTILYSVSGTYLDPGDSIKSTGQAGDSVTVVSTAANQWTITQMKGAWTDNGTQ